MDGLTGFTTLTTEELPDAVTAMDPFHVGHLARYLQRVPTPPPTSAA